MANGNGDVNDGTKSQIARPEPDPPTWTCSDKQKEFILKLVDQHRIDKNSVEALAKEIFGLPVKTLNRLQASGLIDHCSNATATKRTATAKPNQPRRQIRCAPSNHRPP